MMEVRQRAIMKEDKLVSQNKDADCVEEGMAILDCLEINDYDKGRCKEVMNAFYACAETADKSGYRDDGNMARLKRIFQRWSR